MTRTDCHAVEMVGSAPPLIAPTYASARCSSIGPSSGVPLTVLAAVFSAWLGLGLGVTVRVRVCVTVRVRVRVTVTVKVRC